MLDAGRGGFEVAVGLPFTRAFTEEVECTVPVGPARPPGDLPVIRP